MKYIVSFCIPECNNGELAYSLVKEILEYKDPRFQVCIADNASTDNTKKLLDNIYDERLKVKYFEERCSATDNFLRALDMGDGEYLYFVIGRDRIRMDRFNILLEYLEKYRDNEINCFVDSMLFGKEIFLNSILAFEFFTGRNHDTGFIIKKNSYICSKKHIQDKSIVNNHRIIYVYSAMEHGAIIIPGLDKFMNMSLKSARGKEGINQLDEEWSYKYLTDMTFNTVAHIECVIERKMNINELSCFYKVRYINLLRIVSESWKALYEDYEVSSHCRAEKRYVSRKELIDNIIKLYEYYNKKNHISLTIRLFILLKSAERILELI